MVHRQATPCFQGRDRRLPGPRTEAGILAGKPRHRRHHLGAHLATTHQMAQAVFHEHAVIAEFRVGVEGRKNQQAYGWGAGYLHVTGKKALLFEKKNCFLSFSRAKLRFQLLSVRAFVKRFIG